ncbi:16S rRNA (guanine(966)-N(2))-methyltransferase RsmD [Burkholderiaceae bacterium DAT-1]|nr:16S rRNA (guanine(966)-N(2))-methyltransferase RsmD [Burkholderiaceae bacterium DAT-1]
MKPTRKSTGKSVTSNQVRIIGGDFRRRMISFPDGEGLRPTPDRVRETLFNWLGQELHGQTCLDMFAGSGALGFEAASRGAKRVVMLELARTASNQLKANKDLLKATSAEVIQGDSLAWLARSTESFDVVFLDPPYASTLLDQALPLVRDRVHADSRVYLECASLPDLSGWVVLREGKAGQVHYLLLEPESLT